MLRTSVLTLLALFADAAFGSGQIMQQVIVNSPASSQCLPSTTRFMVPGGDGIYADTGNWSASDNGASGSSAPVSTTVACADGNSGTGTLTLNANAQAASLDMAGFGGTFAFSTHQMSAYIGSLIFGAGETITASTGAQLNF